MGHSKTITKVLPYLLFEEAEKNICVISICSRVTTNMPKQSYSNLPTLVDFLEESGVAPGGHKISL